jgi:hypothetical protein
VDKYFRARQATDDNMLMRIACWINKATNTHTGYVIFTAFPPQQRLHERTSLLRYTYIASRVLLFKMGDLHPNDIQRFYC